MERPPHPSTRPLTAHRCPVNGYHFSSELQSSMWPQETPLSPDEPATVISPVLSESSYEMRSTGGASEKTGNRQTPTGERPATPGPRSESGGALLIRRRHKRVCAVFAAGVRFSGSLVLRSEALLRRVARERDRGPRATMGVATEAQKNAPKLSSSRRMARAILMFNAPLWVLVLRSGLLRRAANNAPPPKRLWRAGGRVRLGTRKQPFGTMRLTMPARLLPPGSAVTWLQAATRDFDRPPR